MKHDEAHEKKQNKALETVIDALIEHIGRDMPHATDTLLKLQEARAALLADDAEVDTGTRKTTMSWSDPPKAK